MANKLITIGQGESAELSSSDEIYLDVDMVGADNPGRRPAYSGYWYDLRSSDDSQAPDGLIDEQSDSDDPVEFNLQTGDESEYERQLSAFNVRKFAVSRLVNVKAVQNGIKNIFTWIPGERILTPEFGSNIRKLLYEGITSYTSEAIVAEIKHAIQTWEPRVSVQKVVNVSTTSDTENNTIHIRIVYTIPSLSEKQFWYDYVYHNESES